MTDTIETRAGSIWRRWDLHIHAPGTKLSNAFGDSEDDGVWEQYIDVLEDSPVQVFGITDYFCCDTYFKFIKRFRDRKPESRKIFFPNLELRLSQSISADGSHPNIHVIFDNNPELCSLDKLTRFLTNLETQSINDENARCRCADLRTKADFESATVSLDDLLGALKKTFGDGQPYLIAFPANNDGLRSTDTNEPRKVGLADRIDKTCHLFFGRQDNRDWLLKTDRYASGEADPKPVVSGTDAHSFEELERLGGDVAGFPPTWIKADTTFSGLRQIGYEPESRVHIGAEPGVITRQGQDGTKFLTSLQIDQVTNYDERNGRWFKKVNLPLNPELVAIIGNKGSGKSAIVDIIGLLGESRQEAYFSFLTDDAKSKKFRQRGFAENFISHATWLSEKVDEKLLSDHCDTDRPETVRYLPQNYFEQLTNEIVIEQFRNEMEEVVFSHVEETEKLGKSTFAALEEARTLQSKHEISALKTRLRELNIEIVQLEEQMSPQYRKRLVAVIVSKKEELQSIDSGKPKEIDKPDIETEEQKELAAEVDRLTALLSELNEAGQEKVAEISGQKAKLQHAVSLKEALTRFQSDTVGNIAEYQDKLKALDLKPDDLFQFAIDLKPLDLKIAGIQTTISSREKDNKKQFTRESDFEGLSTLPDLRAAYAFIAQEIDQRKEQLSTPQRRYQAYIERLNSWSAKRLAVIGSPDEPKPNTLSWLEQKLQHIDDTLAAKLEEKIVARRTIVEKIFDSKHAVLLFYSDLKRSVEERLRLVRTEGFEIEIDASFVVDRDFLRQFLNQINQRRKGPYKNDMDAQHEIAEKIRQTDWNDLEAVVSFCHGLLDRMKNNNGEDLAIADQAHDVKELYDFLFSLDYLSSKYELRLGGKNLNELSPGEKGLLLLIFYLQLDRNSTPLVIDQPEDNLDNDSIFQVLAKCIREAKKNRQVILVTHNPNLAVGADAEQIIYVKLEKSENYKFSYESGSIENPKLNRRIVDVLEGSQPAFVKRRLKYGIK